MRKTIKILSLTVLLCSFLNLVAQDSKPTNIRYLALGDSYTIGQSVEKDKKWPVQLKDTLLKENFDFETLKVIAKTGWTTTNLLSALEKEDVSNYNLVSLLIGVNNQFQGLSFGKFKTEFDELLELSIEIAKNKKHVFVVSIPDYGVTPFGSNDNKKIKAEIDEYNTYIKSKCNSLSIPFINITEKSRTLGSKNNALAKDNLHPSENQYKEWVKIIYPVVKNILEQ